MELRRGAQRGWCSALYVFVLGGLLAACAPQLEQPAPVITNAPPVERTPERITVQRGQTLSEIAHSYHVPMRVIAEANGLVPPYRIQIGRTLVIPGAAPSRVAAAGPAVAAPSSTPPAGVRPPGGTADLSAPTAPDKPPVVAALPAPTSPPPEPQSPTEAPAPTRTVPDAPTEANRAAAPPPTSSAGTFLWPVRGHVLATYGSKLDGTRNDGINISAPRGAAVQAIDGGVVAYTGNELRGYGNLVLIKHPNGWISAYAHCDKILVTRGEKVERGQVIARVGSTGNVSEPQLHFELRRGQRPVDPREFLPASPTAELHRAPEAQDPLS
jgi:murein DD-endopeptidase MepM/ murein hydrolase activator NlpD